MTKEATKLEAVPIAAPPPHLAMVMVMRLGPVHGIHETLSEKVFCSPRIVFGRVFGPEDIPVNRVYFTALTVSGYLTDGQRAYRLYEPEEELTTAKRTEVIAFFTSHKWKVIPSPYLRRHH